MLIFDSLLLFFSFGGGGLNNLTKFVWFSIIFNHLPNTLFNSKIIFEFKEPVFCYLIEIVKLLYLIKKTNRHFTFSKKLLSFIDQHIFIFISYIRLKDYFANS